MFIDQGLCLGQRNCSLVVSTHGATYPWPVTPAAPCFSGVETRGPGGGEGGGNGGNGSDGGGDGGDGGWESGGGFGGRWCAAKFEAPGSNFTGCPATSPAHAPRARQPRPRRLLVRGRCETGQFFDGVSWINGGGPASRLSWNQARCKMRKVLCFY